ncbi:MotE family protein [Oceanobacillus sp. Castelsardo]|uniref:MotE family protein n=1 Tax=Oceanobacillus sp. Castelsardo TaxID=1851204 RepID=UPI0008391B1C|nr:hypothetical protein [Oceanobacillus sp. Castelsardo]
MAKKKNDKSRKINPFLWFVFAVVIPVAVVISIVLIILNIAGFDAVNWLKEKGNSVPVISNMITTDDEGQQQSSEMHLQKVIEKKDEKIEDLTQSMNDQEAKIQDLEREITQLEKKESDNKNLQETMESEEEDSNKKVKTVAKSYEEMAPEKAAEILTNMADQSSLVLILKEISNDSRGKILQEMDPKKAAEVTKNLMEN